MFLRVALTLGVAIVGLVAQAGEVALRPFVVEWRENPNSPADVSFLLQAPAGRHGFVRSDGGHLVEADGRRLRLWGVNATMQAGLPSREAASVVAANLARLGVNCVRFHFLDRPAPTGLIDARRDDTRALDPAQLDRLDFFISQLKHRGIYSDLNLNVGRSYKAGDGVRDHELLGFAKSITYFDERLIELQKEYARQLLTHRNPYTESEYRAEPAVALVEMLNENSIVEAWFGGRLLGRHTAKNPGTWSDIPASYADKLTEKFNVWLTKHFSAETRARWKTEAGVESTDLLPRLTPDQFAKASKDRFHAEASFYMELERDFFTGMRDFLRDELGVKSLLVGNSDHGHYRTGYPQLCSTALLDVVDSHVYWQHPRYLNDSKTGKRAGFEIPNTPMVNDPMDCSVVQLSRSAIAGKPFIVSEVNHPFPNEYAAEGIPILAAYAAMHDWDGVFWYTLGHRDVVGADLKVGGHFDMAPDPVKMCQLAAGSLMFLRADVQAARRTIERSYTVEQVRESIRMPSSQRPYFTPGFPLTFPLQHATRIRSFEGPPTASAAPAAVFPVSSDTGELTWNWNAQKQGSVIINTPRSQAVIGFVGTMPNSTANLRIEVDNAFCAVSLHALDGETIAKSTQCLLTLCARAANTNMRWNEKRTSLENWGVGPTVIEPVVGGVVLSGLTGAKRVTAEALDGGGKVFGVPIVAKSSGAEWVLPVGDATTTWYVLKIEH